MAEKFSQKVAGKSSHSGYARIPREVLTDSSLSHSSVRVYGAISIRVAQGTTAKIGQRKLAAELGMDRSTVATALGELLSRGYLCIDGTGRRRRTYHLTSPVFGQKQRAGVTEAVSAPSGGRRYASVGREIA